LTDFVKRANLSARDWKDFASTRLDTPTLTPILGAAPAYGDLGTATLNLGSARITGFNSGGNQNISFDVIGVTEGIGGVGGGNTLSSSGGEGLRIELAERARQFAMTLSGFGGGTFIIFPYQERVEIRFLDGAATVATTIKQGCHADGGLASFTYDPGVEFDKVEIRPLTTTIALINSAFLLSEFKSCAAGPACLTTLDTGLAPVGNRC
jgi:hypothetical protein